MQQRGTNPKSTSDGTLTLAGFAVAAVIVILLLGASFWMLREHDRAATMVGHTEEVLAGLANARAALLDVQNGFRGFVITGREGDLDPYRNGVAQLDAGLARLFDLTTDNPNQQSRLHELSTLVQARLASARAIIEARRTGGFDEARRLIESDASGRQMSVLRDMFKDLEAEEQRLLQVRADHLQARLRAFWAVSTILVTAMLGTLAILYRQIRRGVAQQVQLLQMERRFHSMMDSIVDYAIMLLDVEGRVLSWNTGARAITGYDEADVVDRHFSCFYERDQVERSKPQVELRIAEQEGRFEEEDWRVRKDGSRFWANVVVTPLRTVEDHLEGFVKVVRDLTERKRTEEELRNEVEERRRIDGELRALNSSLERVVSDRTGELRAANVELSKAKSRLQDLSIRLIAAQEDERRRISHELHDETGQALTGIKMRLFEMLHYAEGPRARIEECVAIVDQTVDQIRNMSVTLRPLVLDDLGLADALEWALDRQAKSAGWHATIHADRLPTRLSNEIETACFRVGQEALTNVARHAGARNVEVSLRVRADRLLLSVSDDGKGFDYAAVESRDVRDKHFGLVSMTERTSLAGGTFEIRTAPGCGTRIEAIFPIDPGSPALPQNRH